MIGWIKVLIVTFLLMMLVLVTFQRRIIYHPPHGYQTPEQAGAAGWQVLQTNQGSFAWWFPAQPGQCTLVYSHGNADNINHSLPVAGPWIKQGFGFVLVEYPGYSNIPGSPTEESIYKAVEAQISLLLKQGVAANRLIFMGHSLGAAVALESSLRFKGKGLIMLSPFQSVQAMAARFFPLLPSKDFLWDKFDNQSKIAKIEVPLFMAHGSNDPLIPQAQGKSLFALAPEPKKAVWTQDEHNDILWDAALREDLKKWLGEQCGK